MKILYYDCFSGISGDMNLGALIDVGVDEKYLLDELKKLHLYEYKIEINNGCRKGINGVKVDVKLEHHHDKNESSIEHHHEHRNLKGILEIIKDSSLNESVKKASYEMFKLVASAEAKVHKKDINDIHFHEVGAVDSIVDIVGAAICLDYLKVDKVICSTVEVGSGFVKCAHGLLPVPAPATSEILKNIPIKSIGIPFEATTPTGAAILAYACDWFEDKKDFKIIKIGYGIGNNDSGDVPNVLRVFIAEQNNKPVNIDDCIYDEALVIETNIDDMNPENYDYIMEQLLSKGALDVFLTPVIMKKGRPGVNISVLTPADNEDDIRDIIFNSSSTIGYRKYSVSRNVLKRETGTIETRYGTIRVKSSYFMGKKVRIKPEYEDCKRLALEKNVGISEIYNEVNKKILR